MKLKLKLWKVKSDFSNFRKWFSSFKELSGKRMKILKLKLQNILPSKNGSNENYVSDLHIQCNSKCKSFEPICGSDKISVRIFPFFPFSILEECSTDLIRIFFLFKYFKSSIRFTFRAMAGSKRKKRKKRTTSTTPSPAALATKFLGRPILGFARRTPTTTSTSFWSLERCGRFRPW